MYLYKTTWYARKQIMLTNPLNLISKYNNKSISMLDSSPKLEIHRFQLRAAF